MDKRTLLALALSFLVFFVWSSLFGPKQKEKPPEEQVAVKEKESKPPLQEKMAPLGTERDVIVEAQTDFQDITVETGLYRAVFSGSGPQIKSFQLKEYRSELGKNAPLRELVHVNNKDGYGLRVGFSGKNVPTTAWGPLRISRKAVTLRQDDQPESLVYAWKSPEGVEIRTAFLFLPNSYDIDLSVEVTNASDYAIDGSILLDIAHMPRETRSAYGSFEGMAMFIGNKLKEVKKDKVQGKEFMGQISWIAYEEPYFMTAIIDEDNKKAGVKSTVLPDGEIRIAYSPASLSLGQNDSAINRFTLYLGPRDLYILKALHKNLEKAINFGWFDIIAKPLLVTLRFFNKYLSNYGLSVILLTILIKILFWPLTRKSYQSMKEMRKLQPMMAKIREKYKHNKQEMNKQLMGLYKTYKINPMGGCLPMVIQMPVFFAFYRILPNSIELRHAPFILWINDLSTPERLFSLPFKIPLMAPPYGIPVLTLLMGASMFLQQKMTPTPGDPAQAKMMMMLPIVFTFLFINFPSGLVLYWLVNNVLSIAQQYMINRKLG
ncbi:MAG TPA: membrane protein insertase YidC [Desulfatiglandales bacterium]|nr:membrane protein insertase YidC [Desulfatiglandales bacterium]